MKAQPDCTVCLFRQALNTVRTVTPDPAVHHAVFRELARTVAAMSFDGTPAALSKPVYRIVSEITGNPDPYKAIKAETNRLAMEILPGIRETVRRSADPLDAALHAAVAGNIIDLGIGHAFDLRHDIADLMLRPFCGNALAAFRNELRPGRKVLYLGDNAGEIVFDTLLVEQLQHAGMEVTFTVKSGPIINDATLADAEQCGLTTSVRVIETGGDDIGIDWNNVSPGFRHAFETADVVIAKGHGNFETCNDRPGNIYFLLKAKCEMVAAALGCRLGDIVFKRGRDLPGRG